MSSPIEAQVILADFAQAVDGKVSMLGAGWSVTGTPTAHQAVVSLIKVPWDRANEPLDLRLTLLDEDGRGVMIANAESPEPRAIDFRAKLEVGRPVGVKPGTPIDSSFVVNVSPLPLPPARYSWFLQVATDQFSTSFQVVAAAPAS